jgi:hypothetical protein
MAEITWSRAVEFVLGGFVLLVVIGLILAFVPYSDVLSRLGITIFAKEEEVSKVDRTFRAFETAFSECSKIQDDNCVCDIPINVYLTDEAVLNIYRKEYTVYGKETYKTIIRLEGFDETDSFYATNLDADFYFLQDTPRDMANWFFHEFSEGRSESSLTGKEMIEVKKIGNGLEIHDTETKIMHYVQLPYRLVKWHGRLMFTNLQYLLDSRTCGELGTCAGEVCSPELCNGTADPYFRNQSGKICCSGKCASASVVVKEDEALFNLAEKFYSEQFYKGSAIAYELFSTKYQLHENTDYAKAITKDSYKKLCTFATEDRCNQEPYIIRTGNSCHWSDTLNKCEPGPACAKGEVREDDYSCKCDSLHGWTSEAEPWRSREPPCIIGTGNIYAIDDSLDTEKYNPDDVGFCIGRPSLKLYYQMENSAPEWYRELSQYEIKSGYVDVVDKRRWWDVKKMQFEYGFLTTRERCFLLMRADRRWYNTFYAKFNEELKEQLTRGHLLDKGLCVGFGSGEDDIVVYEDFTRQDCIQEQDESYNFTFFVWKRAG